MDLWTSEQEISVLLKKGQISSVSSNTFSNNTILPPSPAHQITEGIRKKKTYKADCQHTLITTCSHLQFVPDISPPLPHPALLDRRCLRPPSPQPQLWRSILSSGRATLTSPPSSAAPACTSHKIHCRWATDIVECAGQAMCGTSSIVFRVLNFASQLHSYAPFTTGSSCREAVAVRMELANGVVGTGTLTTAGASRGMRSAPARNPQSYSPQF
jgi:hypothetical protein